MRFFKNKFFIIALSVALILATSATVLSVMGIESPLRSIIGGIATPFRWGAAKISQGIAGFAAYFTEFDRLTEENVALRGEIAELREALAASRADAGEIEFLRGMMGLESLDPEWELCGAVVIGRESGSYMTVYTLNRGSLHGVKENMPVITAEGVVGYVRELGAFWCKVIPIMETISSLGGYVQRSGASGIVAGDYSLRQSGRCRMSYIEEGADIEEGDLIITSGSGAIYPAGLVVGVVEEMVADPFGRTYTATIVPAVDFDRLSRVMIITSYRLAERTEPSDGGEAGENGGESSQ